MGCGFVYYVVEHSSMSSQRLRIFLGVYLGALESAHWDIEGVQYMCERVRESAHRKDSMCVYVCSL